MSDLSERTYLPWDAPGVTDPAPTEAEDTEAIRKLFEGLILGGYNKNGHVYPTTHARTHGVVKGKLIVLPDLPPHLRQSMFAYPHEYPVVMRYSSVAADVGNDDRKSFDRAVSLKIFNVHGERLPGGENHHTQDFSLNSTASEADLSDPKTAREVITIRALGLTDPKKMVEQLAARPDAELQLRGGHAPLSSPAAQTFYSQLPWRFGDYVGKHGLFPATEKMKQLFEVNVDPKTDPPDVMTRWLQKFYAENEAVYDWKWQLAENLAEQPVEFAGTRWDPEKYPYQTVAKLVFPKQETLGYELKSFWEDHMRMIPHYGIKTLEPMGGTNRVRKVVYAFSGPLREKLNGRKTVQVRSLEDLPGPIPEGIHKEGYLEHFIKEVETYTK